MPIPRGICTDKAHKKKRKKTLRFPQRDKKEALKKKKGKRRFGSLSVTKRKPSKRRKEKDASVPSA